MRGGPIFIIGAMGSGTTLLRLILDSHPHIAIPQETGFMRSERALRFIPFKWSGRRWYRRLGWNDEEFNALLRDFYDTVFRRYAAMHGKERWGEKTPLHTWHVDQIARLFPDAVFVGVVRHPGGSVASNMTRWRHPVGKAAYHYLRYTSELARQAARKKDRFVVMRYEELVLHPEAVLRELLEWLDEPWADQVLDHHSVQSGRGGRLSVEGRVRVDDPIDVARVSKWKPTFDALPARQRDEIVATVGRLGEFFGYSFDDPAVLAPLRPDGGLLIHGADVAARMQAFADLDLATRHPVPIFERLYHPRELGLHEVAPAPEPWVPEPIRQAMLPVVLRMPRRVRGRLSAGARVRRGAGEDDMPAG